MSSTRGSRPNTICSKKLEALQIAVQMRFQRSTKKKICKSQFKCGSKGRGKRRSANRSSNAGPSTHVRSGWRCLPLLAVRHPNWSQPNVSSGDVTVATKAIRQPQRSNVRSAVSRPLLKRGARMATFSHVVMGFVLDVEPSTTFTGCLPTNITRVPVCIASKTNIMSLR